MDISHVYRSFFFFFNDTATTEIYTLSLHDALPISPSKPVSGSPGAARAAVADASTRANSARRRAKTLFSFMRSEEHTSELQSRQYLVCRLLLEKKKNHKRRQRAIDIVLIK